MDLIILLISLDIVASKFLDCYIASIKIENSYQERNWVSRKLGEIMGIQNSIWFFFLFTFLAVLFAVWLLFNVYSTSVYQFLYIVTGLYLTTVHLGMAHSNYTGRKNFITERL